MRGSYLVTAIFGLIGVVIGGLLTGAVELYVEHVRNRRALRIAARLLLRHWVGLAVWIKKARSTEEHFEELTRIPFDLTIWKRHEELLTAHLSYDDWNTVGRAADSEKTQSTFAVKDVSLLDREALKDLEELADELEKAAGVLVPLAR